MYDMYNEYENQLDTLKEQVKELQNQMHEYQNLIDGKDEQITQLNKENLFLRNQFKKVLREKNHQQLQSKPEANKGKIPVPEIKMPKIIQKPVKEADFTRPPPLPPPLSPQPRSDVKVSIQPGPLSNGSSSNTLKVNQAPAPSIQTNYNPSSYNPPQNSQVKSNLQHTPSTGVLTRICPKCGAMGFAIKEVEDKSKIICYVPSRIYHKKKVCTKCFFEF